MKVIAAVNGSVVSQMSAKYALEYANVLHYDLVLLYIKNKKDPMEDVNETFETLSLEGSKIGVNIETVILKGDPHKAIKDYLLNTNADTLFCSTRRGKDYFTNSFSERLSKAKLPVNLAVVRVVHLAQNNSFESIILPIKESKLSVKKFTFFSVMAKAFDAKTEVYSITTMSKNKMVHIDIKKAKEMLAFINSNLRHYVQLSKILGFHLTIKHEFTLNEENTILEHIARSNHQLAIIGAKRLSFFSRFLGKEPIEKLLQNSSINTIAFYPQEE
ncbi:MAG: universal stress protein [Campylobacterota bacterium]|nr:universal stress protein [Campylobacterota bacterium]